MDERLKEALIIRLNIIKAQLHANSIANAELETNELLKEVKQGFVAPF